MRVPEGIGIVDTMMGLPSDNRRRSAASMDRLLLDRESREQFDHAASCMYEDLPVGDREDVPIGTVLADMDRFEIERAGIPVDPDDRMSVVEAVTRRLDRLLSSFMVDSNRGVETVQVLVQAIEAFGVLAVTFFPCGGPPKSRSTTERCIPSTPSPRNSTFRSSSTLACPDPERQWRLRMWPGWTRSAGSSPSSGWCCATEWSPGWIWWSS